MPNIEKIIELNITPVINARKYLIKSITSKQY